MLGWVKRHRPPIIIQENVCGAPWAHMIEQYAKEGYTAHSFRVDTKHYYIPHTRTRVYLIAVDSRAGGAKAGCTDDEALVSRCEFAVNALSRPSSASLEAFLLPSDDSRVHRAREALSKPKTGGRDKSMVDWGRCETRHQRARGEENLGLKRPMTHWVSQGHCKLPDFAWGDWAKAQVSGRLAPVGNGGRNPMGNGGCNPMSPRRHPAYLARHPAYRRWSACST